MKGLLSRAFQGLILLGGGRPEVVLPLYNGIQKASAGSQELLRQQSQRKVTFTAETIRFIMLVVMVLGSVILGMFLALSPGDHHPHWGVVVLVGVHWFLVINLVASLAGPSLLVDDDLKVLGWWPVTRRELLLARLGTILKPTLQATAALGTVPVLIYMFSGSPTLLAGLSLAVGLLIQGLGVTFGVAVALALVVRVFGRRRAQRMASLMADGNTFMYFWFLGFLIPKVSPWLSAHPKVLFSLPPLWFAAFGDFQASGFSWLMAAVGVGFSLFLVVAGLRLLVAADSGEDIQPVEKKPSRWHVSSLISSLLKPMMPGREGWVLRRLLENHLREDWRFVGGMLVIPFLMIFMFFGLDRVVPLDIDHQELKITALTSINHSHYLMIMAASVLFAASFSSTPKALWIVGLSDLDTGRLLTAQRGMIRGLILFPVLAIYAVKARVIGAGWIVVGLDCLMLALQMEFVLLLLQPLFMIMPFSLPYTNSQSGRRIGLSMLAGAVAVGFIILNFIYAEFFLVRVLVWVGLPLSLLLVHFWHQKRVAGKRLNMDAVLHG